MTESSPLLPRDEHNIQLEANVRPPGWVNPTPQGRYHLIVIGAGTAGLVTAAGAAGIGAKVALIERNLMGGDCLNVGCVPSKALISAGRAAAAVRRAGEFGVCVPDGVEIDFPAVMRRMRLLRAKISPADSADRFRSLGVDVFLGAGRFVSSDTIDVSGTQLCFRKAVIATGARAVAPPIPGLDSVTCLTNETVFSLTELPPRLGIIGAGPVGCELAQTFAQLGSEVFLVEATHGVLPREDQDGAAIIAEALKRSGVRLLCCGKNLRISPGTGRQARLAVESHAENFSVEVDALLVAAGRAPNVEGLGLEKAGVRVDTGSGVIVDDRLRTTNPRIFAAGDVCSNYRITHAADFMARNVIRNALLPGPAKTSSLLVPWSTYTTPEIAHVGLTRNQAAEQGMKTSTFTQEFADVDRAILEGETEGFVKVLVKAGSDRILGATIVAANAGDLISELTLAMQHGVRLSQLASVIHPYPTQAAAIRQLGDQYNRTRLTPLVAGLFRQWFRLTG